MNIDVTARPVGSYYGGNQGFSVPCPKCGKPALRVANKYVHAFELRLSGNEPDCVWGKPCNQRA